MVVMFQWSVALSHQKWISNEAFEIIKYWVTQMHSVGDEFSYRSSASAVPPLELEIFQE